MPESESRTVQIGEDRLTIQPFRGYKAVKAGNIIGEAMGAYRTILDDIEDYRKDYAERHKVTITRQVARVREMDLPDKAFDAEGKLELPGEPSQQDEIAVVFPRVMALADEQLFSLLALALTPNGRLSQAYEDGEDMAEAIKPMRRALLFEATLPQLIVLIGKVVDLLRGELTGLGEQVGKMRDLVMGAPEAPPAEEPTTTPSESSESTSPTSTSPAEPATPSESPRPTTEDSPPSSTDSPEPTGGNPESPSLASSGASSSPSGSD